MLYDYWQVDWNPPHLRIWENCRLVEGHIYSFPNCLLSEHISSIVGGSKTSVTLNTEQIFPVSRSPLLPMPFSFWLYYIKGCFCSKPSLSLCLHSYATRSVWLCVWSALIRAPYIKQSPFCHRKLRVCARLHTYARLRVCTFVFAYVDVAVWVCFFVLDIWQISRQLSTLRDKGVLLQWLHSADRKSADGHSGWVCSWKSLFECMFLYLCFYWQQWGQISNTFWSCVSYVVDCIIL